MEDSMSEISRTSTIIEQRQKQIEERENRGINKDISHITDASEMLMPAVSSYDAVTNLDVLDTLVKKRTDIRSVNVDEVQEDPQIHIIAEVQEDKEINLEHLENTDAMFESILDENHESKEFVKDKVRTKSHRWGKTKRDRMKTSVTKLRGVSSKIADLKKRQANTKKALTRDESLAAYEDIYAEIRSADRYYAEGMSTSEEEEKYIKLKADGVYYKNMLLLYQREIEFAENKKEDVEKRISERKVGEETEHQIDADNKDLAYWTKREQSYRDKLAEINHKAKAVNDKIDKLNAKS